ncbi:MAG: peptide-methionine (S)-S-oxide reductase MsrA [Verrucomicrobiota bacterium]
MEDPSSTSNDLLETATFGAGCFWCVEAIFLRIDGIQSAQSGYMGGRSPNPTYEEVCTGSTGHAEVVQIKFNPKAVSYTQILEVFWALHDPTTLNRQGADVGTQYRSAIYYHSEEQNAVAMKSKSDADTSGRFASAIVTEISPASEFYPAEDYHQDFYKQNPAHGYCRAVILPKLKKLGI